jgi:hypothetical protein
MMQCYQSMSVTNACHIYDKIDSTWVLVPASHNGFRNCNDSF